MDRRKILGFIGLGGVLPLTQAVASGASKKKDRRFHNVEHIAALETADLMVGDFVTTLGFYSPGDGGAASYEIQTGDKTAGSGDASASNIGLKSGLRAVLIKPTSINYQIFGAKSDGISDDGVAIREAHEYANLHDLPLTNNSGEYWIKNTREIPIQTSVSWGSSIFHIDEKFNTRESVFHVKSKLEPYEIFTDEGERKALLASVKPGAQIIPELAPYANHLLHFGDDVDRIGFRAGARYNSKGRTKEELLYIELQGKVLGDIAWTFKPTVVITAYPCDQSYLIVDGGTFLMSGEDPNIKESLYSQSGILITRSRTKIQNQWVGIEESGDNTLRPRSGFYYFQYTYDVELDNLRLVPREKNRVGDDKDVPEGTYGIGGNRVLNFRLRNLTAEGTDIHWGVMGTNMMKNIFVEKCQINRFDVHFHLWNLTIRDSNIGNKGITITGGGKLIVENTRVQRNDFLNFRRDYGAKWDGEIIMRNCTLQPSSEGRVTLMNFTANDFHYGYPIGLAHAIQVEDMIFDFTTAPNNSAPCWLFRTSEFSMTSEGERLFFPGYINLKNIKVKGRQRGIRIMKLVDAKNYYLLKRGDYDGSMMQSNCSMVLDQVDLEPLEVNSEGDGNGHLVVSEGDKSSEGNYDAHAPHIKLIVKDCDAFSAEMHSIRAELNLQNCIVNRLDLGTEKGFEGSVSLNNCHIAPVVLGAEDKPFKLDTELGTSFTNCVMHLPNQAGKYDPKAVPQIDIIQLNGEVKYNHINTRLSKGWRAHNSAEGISLTDAFLDKLKISSDEV